MKIKILETDSPEVKAAKQALIDLYEETIAEAKKLFKSVEAKDFDPSTDEGKKAISDIIEAKNAELKVKVGSKEITLAEAFKELQDQHDALSAKVKKGEPEERKTKSFAEALKDAYNEKGEEIKGILERGGKQNGPLVLNVKAAVTMGDYNTIEAAGSASHYSLTTNTGIISKIRSRILKYLQNVNVGRVAVERPYAMWIEELDEQGTPIFIGEGDAKTQLSVRYEEREKKARKIGVYGKVTTEMLRYLPQLISYIQGNLVKRMDLKTEDQLFAGDDTGNNLAGIDGYATAFAAGGALHTIAYANEFDVLNAIATQVELAYGVSSHVFVNPRTMQKMKSIKSTTGEPLYKEYMDILGSGDMVVAGQKIVSTPAVAEGSFVGGDLSVVHVGFTDNASIQIGLDGNDFTNNKKTILVEQELVQFVSANDTQCLVKGTFAAAAFALSSTT